MDVEHYFLSYAFPCAFILKEQGEINEEEFQELYNSAKNLTPISKERLEKVFHNAFAKMKKYNKNVWLKENISHYFKVQHNKEIEAKEGFYATAPEHICNLSKVYKGKVLEVRNDTLLVKYSEGKRRVFNDFVKAQVGDLIFIHFGYAAEMASEK